MNRPELLLIGIGCFATFGANAQLLTGFPTVPQASSTHTYAGPLPSVPVNPHALPWTGPTGGLFQVYRSEPVGTSDNCAINCWTPPTIPGTIIFGLGATAGRSGNNAVTPYYNFGVHGHGYNGAFTRGVVGSAFMDADAETSGGGTYVGVYGEAASNQNRSLGTLTGVKGIVGQLNPGAWKEGYGGNFSVIGPMTFTEAYGVKSSVTSGTTKFGFHTNVSGTSTYSYGYWADISGGTTSNRGANLTVAGAGGTNYTLYGTVTGGTTSNYGANLSATGPSGINYAYSGAASGGTTSNYGANLSAAGTSGTNYALSGTASGGTMSNYGANVSATGASTTNYGLRASVSGAGLNYAVYGQAAMIQPIPVLNWTTVTSWAGYFDGHVQVVGSFISASDQKLKKDIRPLEGALALLNDLHAKRYYFDKEGHPNMQLPYGEQFGLIAQEVQKVAPNLVVTATHPEQLREDGTVAYPAEKYLAMNYVGLIPILIGAVQEQQSIVDQKQEQLDDKQTQIDALKERLAQLEEKLTARPATASDDFGRGARLEQNTPNPFNENTVIRYSVPENFPDCSIQLLNENGVVLKIFDNLGVGSGQLLISAGSLAAGKYIYTLIADGERLLSKTMVITQ